MVDLDDVCWICISVLGTSDDREISPSLGIGLGAFETHEAGSLGGIFNLDWALALVMLDPGDPWKMFIVSIR